MNQVWRLARKPPRGGPSEGDFALTDETSPRPREGQVSTRTIYVSMDPYQWGRRRNGVEAVGDVWHGIERVPAAFGAMLSGGNFGKTLVRVGEDATLLDGAVASSRQRRDVLA